MAGIIAAATNNGTDIAGVGYAGVKVMPVTVLGADGTGQDSDIIAGIVWATDHGADAGGGAGRQNVGRRHGQGRGVP